MRRIILFSVMFVTVLLFLTVVPVYANLTGYAVTIDHDSNLNVIYSIDLATGTATVIGSTGIPYPDDIVEGLAIDSSGSLFAITDSSKLNYDINNVKLSNP